MNASDYAPPIIPAWFQNGFHRFLSPFLRRHFHCVAIARECRFDRELGDEIPLIIYGNHPSWWDPLIGHFLNRMLFAPRQFYAPIDADALAQYRVFAKLGFYGVRLTSTSGAAAFLKQSLAIANSPNTALWITPEGRFADVRDMQATLMPGLAHLCTRLNDGWVLPLALEYPFWEERLPECLVKLGQPFRIGECKSLAKPEWQKELTARLRETQVTLAELSIARSSAPFEPLLRGRRGVGGFYDSLRRIKAWQTKTEFRASHGDQFE